MVAERLFPLHGSGATASCSTVAKREPARRASGGASAAPPPVRGDCLPPGTTRKLAPLARPGRTGGGAT
eukprot:1407481-Alexandrium_andersonii.AAC.1